MAEIKPTLKEEPQKKERHGSEIVWALFLIFIGVVFLLNNLGILPWNVWLSLWRFWPLLLVLWGIQLVLGGSWAAAVGIAIVSLLTFCTVIALVLTTFIPDLNDHFMRFAPWWNNFRTQITSAEEQTKQITVEEATYPTAKERDVSVKLDWGSLTLADDKTTNFFTVNAVYFGSAGEPEVQSSLGADGILNLTLTTVNEPGFPHFRGDRQTYAISLGKSVLPTQLEVDLGAGEGTIDLIQLKTKEITAKVGAGKLTLSLDGDAIPTGGVKLDVGAGTAGLNIPTEIGFKVKYNVGVGEFKIDGNTVTSGLSGDGTYTSENYADAAVKLEIEVSVGAGSVHLQTQ